ALASLLVAQSSNAVSNSLQYDSVQRTAVQLQEAVEARAVVDQAKGILMHALGCDAEEAFAEMRRISQTRHVKLTALAQRIVGDQGLPAPTGGDSDHSVGQVPARPTSGRA
ncbi:ANTAR domain-containing response regulator, partial [Actinomadura adrarensis]